MASIGKEGKRGWGAAGEGSGVGGGGGGGCGKLPGSLTCVSYTLGSEVLARGTRYCFAIVSRTKRRSCQPPGFLALLVSIKHTSGLLYFGCHWWRARGWSPAVVLSVLLVWLFVS